MRFFSIVLGRRNVTQPQNIITKATRSYTKWKLNGQLAPRKKERKTKRETERKKRHRKGERKRNRVRKEESEREREKEREKEKKREIERERERNLALYIVQNFCFCALLITVH